MAKSSNEIRQEMHAIEKPHAVRIRKLMKTARVSDEAAVNALREYGVIPAHVTLEAFREHELRCSMYR